MRVHFAVATCVAAAIILAGCGGSGAHAPLIPNKSIGGVRLYETRAAVAHALGEPGIVRGTRGPRIWYPHHKLTVAYAGRGEQARAAFIFTRDPQYRPSSGLSVGSKMSDVARLVPGIVCSETGTNCQLGGVVGKPATLVGGVRDGRVTEIWVLIMTNN